MLINMVCPRCVKPFSASGDHPVSVCPYCGTPTQNIRFMFDGYMNTTPVTQAPPAYKINNIGKPNLIINYMSINPNVRMTLRIVQTGSAVNLMTGQSVPFRLVPASYTLILTIGTRSYSRRIQIIAGDNPVTIYASWNGRAGIQTNQPPYPVPVPQYYPPQFNPYAGDPRCPVQGDYQCNRCFNVIHANEAACPNCGNPIFTDAKPPVQVCAVCGNPVSGQDKFCAKCGTMLR